MNYFTKKILMWSFCLGAINNIFSAPTGPTWLVNMINSGSQNLQKYMASDIISYAIAEPSETNMILSFQFGDNGTVPNININQLLSMQNKSIPAQNLQQGIWFQFAAGKNAYKFYGAYNIWSFDGNTKLASGAFPIVQGSNNDIHFISATLTIDNNSFVLPCNTMGNIYGSFFIFTPQLQQQETTAIPSQTALYSSIAQNGLQTIYGIPLNQAQNNITLLHQDKKPYSFDLSTISQLNATNLVNGVYLVISKKNNVFIYSLFDNTGTLIISGNLTGQTIQKSGSGITLQGKSLAPITTGNTLTLPQKFPIALFLQYAPKGTITFPTINPNSSSTPSATTQQLQNDINTATALIDSYYLSNSTNPGFVYSLQSCYKIIHDLYALIQQNCPTIASQLPTLPATFTS